MTGLAERLADLASGAMLDNARVTGCSRLSPEFVRLKLSAEAFRKATWVPGAKLQFRPRRGSMSLRTYTPISWDAARGVTELIAYTHGTGPAAHWFERVTEGQTCEVFGPRRSIDGAQNRRGGARLQSREQNVDRVAAIAPLGRPPPPRKSARWWPPRIAGRRMDHRRRLRVRRAPLTRSSLRRPPARSHGCR